MKCLQFVLLLLAAAAVGRAWSAVIDHNKEMDGTSEQLLHFGYRTENGQMRTEDIKYNSTIEADEGREKATRKAKVQPVEYRGGYSFISADGYEYMVLYKANKNGFQPYVTARKLKDTDAITKQ